MTYSIKSENIYKERAKEFIFELYISNSIIFVIRLTVFFKLYARD